MPEWTKDYLNGLPLAESGQYVERDPKIPGHLLVIGRTAKTFTVQVDVVTPLGKRQTRKKALGRWPILSIAEARKLAQEAKVDLSRAGGGREGGPLSLGKAWQELRPVLEAEVAAGRRSARTLESYDYNFRLLGEWEKTPLARLADSSPEVREKHRALTAERGPSAANGAMVFLRRVYNYALKKRLDPNLSAYNPAYAVDFNPQPRRNTAMGVGDLPGWWMQLEALPNLIRREFHLFCLLSGSRPGALTVAKWEHLDLKRRVLHIPQPKGGTVRAFDIPLSREMIRCLWRVRKAGRVVNGDAARVWVFPGDMTRSHSATPQSEGHMVEWKEKRRDLSKWGNDLRQTYRTLAAEAGVSKADVMVLMNHADRDVSDGYVTRSKIAETYLRAQQEKMSQYIMAACRKGG